MANLILYFPIFACLLIYLTQSKKLADFLIIFYAILHFIVSIAFCLNINLLPMISDTKFFEINEINRIFLLVISIIYLAFSIYNKEYMKDDKENERRQRHYAYMILSFVFAMTGAILSTNIGVNWVFIEGTTLASVYLIYYHKTKHSIEAAWKYVFICSIGIALAFAGIIFLTIATGNVETLFYKDLYKYANVVNYNQFWLQLSFVFILFGIGTKMGLAPVHFWLPDAHAEAPSSVSALLSATLLNSAFLMIINVFKILIRANCYHYGEIMLLVMGFLSLFVSSVFVYHINNYKRMLAYSSIENMGILAIGLSLGKIGIFASIVHLVGHSLIKASFFLTSGNILKLYYTKKIKNVKGLINLDKKTGWLWVLSFLGISAFPTSILFISEFLIIKTMLKNGQYVLCGLFLILLTIILYGIGHSVINMAFGKKNDDIKPKKLKLSMYLPQITLLSIAFLLGVYMPDFISEIFTNAVDWLWRTN